MIKKKYESKNVTANSTKKSIRWPHDLYEKIVKAAENENKSISEWIRDAAEEKLNK